MEDANMRCLFAALIAAVTVIFFTPLQCRANDFTDEELKAAAATKSLAIQGTAKKVADLERSHKASVRPDQKKELLEKIKQARREYNSIKKKSLEDFAAEARNPNANTAEEDSREDAGEKVFSDPPMREPPASEGPSSRPRTVDEIIADVDARRKAKADAMRGLTVRFPYSRVWTPRDKKAVEIGLCEILFDGEPPTQGFFPVGSKTQEVVVESSDTQVIAPTRDPKHVVGPYYIVFGKPGKATITVRVGDYKVSHEMEVVMAPVAPGDQTDFVIREMGLPTHKTKVFVKWPNLERHDCFLYKPKPAEPFMGEHWWFEKSQDLILSIENGAVYDLGTNRNRTTNQIELRAEVPDPN
jgi:hypothetical protein